MQSVDKVLFRAFLILQFCPSPYDFSEPKIVLFTFISSADFGVISIDAKNMSKMVEKHQSQRQRSEYRQKSLSLHFFTQIQHLKVKFEIRDIFSEFQTLCIREIVDEKYVYCD